MKEIKFETIYSPEEICKRINTLIDSESIIDTDKTLKPFNGYCNVCKFEMIYPRKSFDRELIPKYIIKGSIKNHGNLREVYFYIRKSVYSYLGTFFIFVLYIIASLKGPRIVLFKFSFILSGAVGYYFSMKKSNKRKRKIETIISEQIIKSILNN